MAQVTSVCGTEPAEINGILTCFEELFHAPDFPTVGYIHGQWTLTKKTALEIFGKHYKNLEHDSPWPAFPWLTHGLFS